MKISIDIKTTTITIAAIMLLSACGGGSDKKKSPSPAPAPLPKIDKLKKCQSGFVKLKKGDKITALAEGTKVKIRHIDDGTREACIESGEAKIN